jgi:hypothetical protein
MNNKFLKVALGIVLTATAMSASAQKTYTQGLVTLSASAMGQAVEMKEYFTPDSVALTFNAGPAALKILSDAKNTFFAILVDVPVASIKKAAVLTPAEIEQQTAEIPKFTYAPAADTKVISGFNCKKVVATDTKTNKTYDVWVTNDVKLPEGTQKYYAGISGVPIQYTSFAQGKESSVTVTAITDVKSPAGTFVISPDFERISYDDLKAMGGGR